MPNTRQYEYTPEKLEVSPSFYTTMKEREKLKISAEAVLTMYANSTDAGPIIVRKANHQVDDIIHGAEIGLNGRCITGEAVVFQIDFVILLVVHHNMFL